MTPRTLILHCDRKTAEAGRQVLDSSGYQCMVATGFEEALALLESQCPQLLLLDPNAASLNSSQLPKLNCQGPVVAVTTFDTLDAAVNALKGNGARTTVEQSIAHRELLLQAFGLRCTRLPPPPAFWGLVGTSPALKETLELTQKAAHSEASILLCGESGTGKELVAQAIHTNSSPRAARAFVAVDCAALPESLLEAELFGYEKGAFTGAIRTKPGLMELAHRGTLFLDEVGEIPLSLQAKLLRALQEKEHRRVGGTHTIHFDVRVLAATSRDLLQCVKEGSFRQDLFFRLNVIPIRLPPLREREGDVTLLANYFLEQYSEIDTGMSKSFDADVLRVLESYPWPGNVRELQNIVRRMCVLAEGSVITTRDLPAELLPNGEQLSFPATPAPIKSCELTFMEAKRRYVNLFEAAYMRGILERYTGNVSRAAEAADVDRKTFYRLLRKHHVQPHAFPAQDLFAASSTGRWVVT